MMKTKIVHGIIILNLIMGMNGFAQMTLTRQNAPLSGDILMQYDCDTTGIGINSGASGPNVIWDFSMINPITPGVSIGWGSNIITPLCHLGGFPNANMVSGGYTSHAYYYIDTTDYLWLGSCNDAGGGAFFEVHCTDPLRKLKFPWTYADTLTDNGGGPYHYATSNHYLKESLSEECDGWGTLILPWATYDSCLRVHGFQITRDSIIGVGTVRTTFVEFFNWYSNAVRGESMRIVSFTQQDSTGNITFSGEFMVVYTTNPILNINDIRNINGGLTAYPNPSDGLFTIQIPQILNSRDLTLNVYNCEGKLIRKVIPGKQDNISINLIEEPSGIYHCVLLDGVNTFQTNIVKE